MDSPLSRDSSEPPIDPAQPFKGVVVCCTSIPPDQRTDIAKKTEELGGIHKYDLTPDVTHLIVGDYDTPKYRHVAKERTDIKAMDARWIDAVSQLWMNDAEINFATLEREWQLKPLETCGDVIDEATNTHAERGSLLLCMTGFDDPEQRNQIIDRIVANGGTYTGDLTKRVSYLIVHKPEGKKYKAARAWNIRTVSLVWLEQTIERGMILDEQCFDPFLPPEEQGQGAWNKVNPRRASLKRSRSSVGESGQRKLRKTASMKLGSQRDNIWGQILGSKPTPESSTREDRSERIEVQDSGVHDAMVQPAPDAGIFSACHFFASGFEIRESDILSNTISSMGGKAYNTFAGLIKEAGGARPARRFLVVPQKSQPSTHFQVAPNLVEKIEIVTEFFIEQCMHYKALCEPDAHVLGRPFPKFPISGFENLSICTAGFTGIDLLHVEKSIVQIGGKYAARFNDTASVLLCKSLAGTRKEKLKFALDNDIPVVSSDWLWECITTGYNVPVADYMFPELKQNRSLQPKPRPTESAKETKQPIQRTQSAPIPHMPKRAASRHTSVAGIDRTAFQDDGQQRITDQTTATKEDPAASLQFQTAKTHQMDSFGSGTVPAPLSNASSSALNKSLTLQRTVKPTEKTRSGSVADSMEPTPIPIERQDTFDEQDQSVPAAEESMVDAAADEDREAELKRQRDAQKAAEKEVLTSKLTSLIESSTTGSENPHDDEHHQQRRPRKRGIFGRVVSNASAASSGSAESRIDALGRPIDEQEQQGQEPPATQVQYEDPGAEEHRQKILSKMLGEEPKPAAANKAPKLKIGGFEFDGEEGGRLSRRQTRRNA